MANWSPLETVPDRLSDGDREEINLFKERLLELIDPGANNDEPVKGVTQGDVRGWFDEIELLGHLAISMNTRLVLAETALNAAHHTVVNVIGGTVEGHPTSTINYLQRLRELLRIEAEAKARAAARRFEIVEGRDALRAAEAEFRKACDEARALRDYNDGNDH